MSTVPFNPGPFLNVDVLAAGLFAARWPFGAVPADGAAPQGDYDKVDAALQLSNLADKLLGKYRTGRKA
ncbi:MULTISPECIES: hypothetical protein [unclassified Chelatococcus]|uniref:hypothetical protein n=1 Tax=unclassified Chelatococcus TaxID=2638111 RepID=UPI001BCF113B|nr:MULTISPECIES: hypothetical protein [unclassified Chelatococcus]MBS7699212.1 hypothetical protein [Chelatococcus sp. YT9]MBX3554993.1 hypothetical protein [Chelatococcus sp.]